MLCEWLASLSLAGGKPMWFWVADEHRYGLIPVVRKCWTPRGVRPTVPNRTNNGWGYLCFAMEVHRQNAAEYLCLPEVSLEMSGFVSPALGGEQPERGTHRHLGPGGLPLQAGFARVPTGAHLVSVPPI